MIYRLLQWIAFNPIEIFMRNLLLIFNSMVSIGCANKLINLTAQCIRYLLILNENRFNFIMLKANTLNLLRIHSRISNKLIISTLYEIQNKNPTHAKNSSCVIIHDVDYIFYMMYNSNWFSSTSASVGVNLSQYIRFCVRKFTTFECEFQ